MVLDPSPPPLYMALRRATPGQRILNQKMEYGTISLQKKIMFDGVAKGSPQIKNTAPKDEIRYDFPPNLKKRPDV